MQKKPKIHSMPGANTAVRYEWDVLGNGGGRNREFTLRGQWRRRVVGIRLHCRRRCANLDRGRQRRGQSWQRRRIDRSVHESDTCRPARGFGFCAWSAVKPIVLYVGKIADSLVRGGSDRGLGAKSPVPRRRRRRDAHAGGPATAAGPAAPITHYDPPTYRDAGFRRRSNQVDVTFRQEWLSEGGNARREDRRSRAGRVAFRWD